MIAPPALLGLGGMEILILALLGLMFLGAPAIVLLLVLSRKSGGPSAGDYNALVAENERLRAENERLRRDQP